MLSLLKKINCLENLVTYVDILVTNEPYTFMKADLETERQLWREPETRAGRFGHISGF